MKIISHSIVLIFIACIATTSCNKPSTQVQGYVDADYTYIAGNFSGFLTQLKVSRGDQVTKSQLLFILDNQPQNSQVKNSQARVETAVETLKQKEIELAYQANLYKHYQELVRRGGVSREEFNSVQNKYFNAELDVKIANSNWQAALATLNKMQWEKSNKMLSAPIAGTVYDTYYTQGELVPAQQPVISLLAPENIKVTFYISEPLLAQLKLKQNITITCDNCNNPISAYISYISSKTEYTPPYIYSETARTKFVYRIEAKLTASTPALHPGQPVNVILF